VNIRGNVARVLIRESEDIPEDEGYEASNIVAARDGEIYLFEDTRGNILLEIGDYVREGELIVSGLYDSERGELRYTRSRGRVLARCEHTVELEIPLHYQKKQYTGREYTEKYLVFFEKEIKFFESSGNLYQSYDTIDTVEYLDFLSRGALPVGIRTRTHREYVLCDAVYSESEARKSAEELLAKRISEIPFDTLLSKSVTCEMGEEALLMKCRLWVIEDIAREVEIEIVG
jgi:similar to stage IV sporulation protein